MFFDLVLGALTVTIATSIGAVAAAFFNKIAEKRYTMLLAFAAGMMIYSAMEMFLEANKNAGNETALFGFLVGVSLIFIAEKLLPHLHKHINKTDLPTSKKKVALIVGTITLHNVPEGFAVAAAFASSTPLGWFITTAIAIQDVPEGALITGPLSFYGLENKKSMMYGILSGITEGVAAIVGYLFLSVIIGLVPIALSLSAGAMTYVVLMELLPDSLEHQKDRAMNVIVFLVGIIITFLLAGLFS